MTSEVLYLREFDSINLPATGDAISIVAVRSTPKSGGLFDVIVEGVATGSSTCLVSLMLGDSATESSATPSATTRLFSSHFLGVPLTNEKWLRITARNTASGATAADSLVLGTPKASAASLVPALLSALEKQRFDFLAGTPDRQVSTGVFSRLALRPILATTSSLPTLIVGTREELSAYELAKIVPEARPAMGELWDKFVEDEITYTELVRGSVAALNNKANLSRRPAEPGERSTWSSVFSSSKEAPTSSRRGKVGAAAEVQARDDNSPIVFDMKSATAFWDTSKTKTAMAEAKLSGLWTSMLATDGFNGRVGLLFAERLRFQPSGLVVGEQIYTLSLAPGEEVQLRQVVETKRQITAEDISDREQETSRNLSSSWSTDISEGLSSQNTLQEAMNFGANANVQLPIEELPIGLGANVSHSTSSADTTSRERSIKTSVQRTLGATARMRAQHKIRLEITNEVGTTLAATRTIKNQNAQRATTYVFSKVYRKERVTLERHDVQLCLRLVVTDPSQQARQTFLSNLAKINPNDPANYPEAAPRAISVGQRFQLLPDTNTRDESAGHYSAQMDVNLKADLVGNAIPSGSICSDFRLKVLDFYVRKYEWNFWITSEDTTERHSSYAELRALGGEVRWLATPQTGQSEAKGTVVVTFPFRKDYGGYGLWGNSTSVDQVWFRVEANWVPSQMELDSRASTIDRLREELTAACTEERVRQLRDIAISDYSGQTVAKAFAEKLDGAGDIASLRHIFDFNSVKIESVPYWASGTGRTIYRSLEENLRSLPIPLSMSEILAPELTTPQAVVYVPVFAGHEADALDFLSGVTEPDKRRLVSDLQAYRRQHFVAALSSLPQYSDVLGPKPPIGTPAAAGEWANEWEKPQQKFDVLAHWQTFVPTDGVHVEARLSDSVATDEHQTRMLENQADA